MFEWLFSNISALPLLTPEEEFTFRDDNDENLKVNANILDATFDISSNDCSEVDDSGDPNPFQGDEELLPFEIGSEYSSEDSLMKAAQAYAVATGFVMTKGRKVINKDGAIKRELKCSCSGTADRHCNTAKTNCKASFWCRYEPLYSMWRVERGFLNHNHELLNAGDASMVAYNRYIPPAIQERLLALDRDMTLPVKGLEAVVMSEFKDVKKTWNISDISTLLQKERKGKMPQAVELLNAFEKLQTEDDKAVAEMDTRDNVLHAAFWATGTQRQNVIHFGDVVLFDPTYRCNALAMPIAAFIGIDANGRTITLAVCVIGDEKAETIAWVFEQYTKLGRMPDVIFTDDDHAINAAVVRKFPESKHRLCLWHLSRNIMKNMTMKKEEKDNFMREFSSIAQAVMSERSFEDKWEHISEKYRAITRSTLPYLNRLFDSRMKWARAYFKDEFDAGMRTTQRSESWNACIKRIVSSRTRLGDLFGDILEKQLVVEQERAKADLIYDIRKPLRAVGFPFEVDTAKRITRYAFSLLQQELEKAIDYAHEDNFVWHRSNPHKRYFVDEEGFCACGFDSSFGIPCRHKLKFAIATNMEVLPESWINQRYRKSAPSSVVTGGVIVISDSPAREVTSTPLDRQKDFNDVMATSKRIATRLQGGPLWNEYKALLGDIDGPHAVKRIPRAELEITTAATLQDPASRRGKGRPPTLRLRSAMEGSRSSQKKRRRA